MKKQFVAIMLMLSLSWLLFSCSPTDDKASPSNQDDLIFNIVVGSDFESEKWYDLYKAAGLYFGSTPTVANDSYDEADAEIVIGRSEREISKIAAYDYIEDQVILI